MVEMPCGANASDGTQRSFDCVKASRSRSLYFAQYDNVEVLRRGLKLLHLALRAGTGAPALSRLDDEVVGCVWPEILNPDGVVVVAIRLMGSAPRLFGYLRQIIWVRAVAYDAAAGSSRRPRDFGRRFRGF